MSIKEGNPRFDKDKIFKEVTVIFAMGRKKLSDKDPIAEPPKDSISYNDLEALKRNACEICKCIKDKGKDDTNVHTKVLESNIISTKGFKGYIDRLNVGDNFLGDIGRVFIVKRGPQKPDNTSSLKYNPDIQLRFTSEERISLIVDPERYPEALDFEPPRGPKGPEDKYVLNDEIVQISCDLDMIGPHTLSFVRKTTQEALEYFKKAENKNHEKVLRQPDMSYLDNAFQVDLN